MLFRLQITHPSVTIVMQSRIIQCTQYYYGALFWCRPSFWVIAGAAVSGQYADAREEARDHARLRNMYFQQVLLHALSEPTNISLVTFVVNVQV